MDHVIPADPFKRPAPQPGDMELAVYLHDNCCEDDSCGGWESVGSFGKNGWLDLAREVIAMVHAHPAEAEKGAGS